MAIRPVGITRVYIKVSLLRGLPQVNTEYIRYIPCACHKGPHFVLMVLLSCICWKTAKLPEAIKLVLIQDGGTHVKLTFDLWRCSLVQSLSKQLMGKYIYHLSEYQNFYTWQWAIDGSS